MNRIDSNKTESVRDQLDIELCILETAESIKHGTKIDGRLFPEFSLYCEGHPKPLFRGLSHLIFAIILGPFGFWHLYHDANGVLAGRISAFIFIASALSCYATSALYHIGRWSLNTEITLQKLDHCAITIFAAGTNTPTALLLLPPYQGFILFALSWTTCIWTCWNVFNVRPGVWRIILSSSSIMPFFYTLYFQMNSTEFLCMIANSIVMAAGAAVFVNRWPNPWPKTFGYHEFFHLLTLAGGCCIYLCNWSVIHRSCNIYAVNTEITDILLLFVRSVLSNGQRETLLEDPISDSGATGTVS
jgi:hemolysin III